jgi:Malectin domain
MIRIFNNDMNQYRSNRNTKDVPVVSSIVRIMSLHKFIVLLLFVFQLGTNVVTAQIPPLPIRINCGSTTPVTMNNVTWNRDEYAMSGALYNTCGNTTNSIYCSSRYFQTKKGTPFQYNIPVPFNNTSYQLRLHFAEYVRSCIVSNGILLSSTSFPSLLTSSIVPFFVSLVSKRNSFIVKHFYVYLMFMLKVHWSLIVWILSVSHQGKRCHILLH